MSKVCTACRQEITERYVEIGAGQYLHGACFVCSQCRTSLDGKKATKKNGQLVCGDCVGGPTCHRCHRSIALGQKGLAVQQLHFHDPGCLVCAEPGCGVPIPTNALYLTHAKNDIFCKNHTYV